jgi:hypothetical protein
MREGSARPNATPLRMREDFGGNKALPLVLTTVNRGRLRTVRSSRPYHRPEIRVACYRETREELP